MKQILEMLGVIVIYGVAGWIVGNVKSKLDKKKSRVLRGGKK